MRFTVEMSIDNLSLPLDYRPAIISLLKNSLSEYENGRFFEAYYGVGGKKAGKYTFALDLPKCSIENGRIVLSDNKLKLNFSTADAKTNMVFFNALISQTGKSYPLGKESKVKIINMFLAREKQVLSNSMVVKFLAPLCVRKHDQASNKDRYYSYQHEEFKPILREILRSQLTNNNMPALLVEGFDIKPIQAKKTVVKHHGVFVECSLGLFELSGQADLLNYIQQNGLGSRTSAGFGFVQLID